MDGLLHGKPYGQNGWFGGYHPPLFLVGNTHIDLGKVSATLMDMEATGSYTQQRPNTDLRGANMIPRVGRFGTPAPIHLAPQKGVPGISCCFLNWDDIQGSCHLCHVDFLFRTFKGPFSTRKYKPKGWDHLHVFRGRDAFHAFSFIHKGVPCRAWCGFFWPSVFLWDQGEHHCILAAAKYPGPWNEQQGPRPWK